MFCSNNTFILCQTFFSPNKSYDHLNTILSFPFATLVSNSGGGINKSSED